MLLTSQLRSLLMPKREFRRLQLRVTILVVTAGTGFALRFAASTERGPLTAADAERRLRHMHAVWTILEVVIARTRHTLFNVLVYYIRLCVHKNFGPIHYMRL